MFGPSVYILKPLTESAEEWIDERIDPNATWYGGGVAIEHGFIDDVMMGIEIDGLTEQFELVG